MYRFAQTNIQLFNQMYDLGYEDQQTAVVTKSYELAMTLFSGQFRGSGKTFIAHLIGTASILASLRSAPAVISAGLLHAAYDSGDFGDGRRGLSPAKRDYVRAAVGAEVEEYLARYAELKWDRQAVRSIYDRLDSLSSLEKEVVLMRLANEVEDYLDLGILFCGIKKRAQAGFMDRRDTVLCDLAARLGFPEIARLLKDEIEKAENANGQQRFANIGHRDFSFFAPSLSYKRVLELLAKRLNDRANGGTSEMEK